MDKLNKLMVLNKEISFYTQKEDDYISLTDIAGYKDNDRKDFVIQNWLRNRNTLEFIGLWEYLSNPNFKPLEFEGFRNQAGINSFVLSPQKWIQNTNAIGISSKSGRGGGTYAHKDIAFEFASWISPEFKLYLIKEFQRLKISENKINKLDWDIKRNLTKINYLIHTDAIKENLIPNEITTEQQKEIYANEADILNVALFGMTAKEWRDRNKNKLKEENIRDYANISQLICLSNLENLNASFIIDGLSQEERLIKLNKIAINQMKLLLENKRVKQLGKV